MSFSFAAPRKVMFGRGMAQIAREEITQFGQRVALVRGRSVAWADELHSALTDAGCDVSVVYANGEPDVPQLQAALSNLRRGDTQVVVAVGGGSTVDLGKALAALAPGTGQPLDHLEIVGKGQPLTAEPLPFVAIPTTAGTGAEATKNAVIGVPDHARKVSLRHESMLANLAIVDPALTDRTPKSVTLASGLDAITQVIEPYLSCKSNVLTDALCREAIPRGLRALIQLMVSEDPGARDDMALCSLYGGMALANSGLGAVHGFAGVIGGRTGAAHGAICGRLLGPVLRANLAAMTEKGDPARMLEVLAWIAQAFEKPPENALDTFQDWIDTAGLPRLGEMGHAPLDVSQIVAESQGASSMKGNPVRLSHAQLEAALRAAL